MTLSKIILTINYHDVGKNLCKFLHRNDFYKNRYCEFLQKVTKIIIYVFRKVNDWKCLQKAEKPTNVKLKRLHHLEIQIPTASSLTYFKNHFQLFPDEKSISPSFVSRRWQSRPIRAHEIAVVRQWLLVDAPWKCPDYFYSKNQVIQKFICQEWHFGKLICSAYCLHFNLLFKY